jgi:hypothetical protein
VLHHPTGDCAKSLSEILHFSGEILLLNIQIISGAISWSCTGLADTLDLLLGHFLVLRGDGADLVDGSCQSRRVPLLVS